MKMASELEIVFENDSLLVVAKPSGLPSQTTVDPKRPSAEGLAKTYAGATSPCFLVHRLDADTSGILVFAKSKRVATALTESLRKREWTKVYWALTEHGHHPQTEFKVQNHLRPTKEKRGPRTVSLNTVVRSGGDYAETEFSILARSPSGAALVEARPQTGRMHQIRVHLASLGIPILGDSIYGTDHGTKPQKVARLALHAAKLQLQLDNQFYTFAVKPPADFVKLTEAHGIDITAALDRLDAVR